MPEARSVCRWLALAACLGVLGSSAALAGERKTVENFDPVQYTGPMGILAVPIKSEGMFAVQDTENNKILRLSSKDGSFRLPVGKYTLLGAIAYATDDNKDRWVVSYNLSSAKDREVVIEANATKALEIGPPFTASVSVTRNGDEAELSLSLVGRGGDRAIIRKAAASSDPPSFQVTSPAGQVVWQGAFKFG